MADEPPAPPRGSSLGRAAWVGAVALLSLAWLEPIARLERVPSLDGPDHAHASAALAALLFDASTPLAQALECDPRPHPTWLSFLAQAGLGSALGPAAADRALFLAELVLFVAAVAVARRTMHGHAGTMALLALPFAAHTLFRLGFHGFSLGVPLALFALVAGERVRRAPSAGSIAAFVALLGLAWFAHPMPFLAVAAVVALGAALDLGRAELRAAAIARWASLGLFVPLVALSTASGVGAPRLPASIGLQPLAALLRLELLSPIGGAERSVALAIALLVGGLALVGLSTADAPRAEPLRPRRAPLVVLAVASALLAGLGVDQSGAGSIVLPRLQLFAWLPLLLLVREPRARTLRALIVLAVMAAAAVQLGGSRRLLALRAADVDRTLAPITGLAPGERFALLRPPEIVAREERFPLWDVTLHAGGWAAAASGAVDVGNHFFHVPHSPVRSRASAPATRAALRAANARGGLDLEPLRGVVDAICPLGFSNEELVRQVRAGALRHRGPATSCLFELGPPSPAPSN